MRDFRLRLYLFAAGLGKAFCHLDLSCDQENINKIHFISHVLLFGGVVMLSDVRYASWRSTFISALAICAGTVVGSVIADSDLCADNRYRI